MYTMSSQGTHDVSTQQDLECTTSGRVKWFNNKAGYGFITVTSKDHNGEDVFVHHTAIQVKQEQYRYLELCHNGRLDEYVNYYPEDKEVFNKYRDEVNYYITTLYQNYVNCFIKKMDVLKNYPYEFKTHMYQLHHIYLNEIKPGNMQYNNVVQYVNRLPPAKLMFVLNYHLRSAHQT